MRPNSTPTDTPSKGYTYAMTITLLVLAVVLVILAVVALTALLADPRHIQDEAAHLADQETPEERKEFLKHSEVVPDEVSNELSKGEPGGEDASPGL